MKILAFPRDNNPYQEQLYMPMRAAGDMVDYLDGPTGSHSLNLLLWPLLLIIRRAQGFEVFHLHWTYRFVLPWAGLPGRICMQFYFYCFIWLVKALGFKLVWTAHNAMPHQRQFGNDLKARRFLGGKANLVIAHSESAERQLQDLRIATFTVRVVPHGSYVGVYENTISASAARKKLKLPADAFVALFFGRIDSYKNVPALLTAAQNLSKKHDNLYVVIAGSCRDAAIARQLKAAKRKLGKRLKLDVHFIPDDDVQTYFKSANVCVLPFSEITTSGSAILALSFDVPIIAPRLGALKDMPATVGWFYDPAKLDALESTMVKALKKQSLTAQQKAAARYAAKLAWPNIAKQTRSLFSHI
jgi:glycosyltransferase involved in cell wall biosynthesis